MGNKEALLRGALECLLEKGYARTTARDVASRSKTSLAAIGYHFGSTEHLLNEAIADGFRLWRRHIATVLAANAGRPAEDVLEIVGEELSRLFEEHRPLLGVFLEALAMAQRSPEIREHAAALYEEERVAIAALLTAIRGEERGDERIVASVVQAVADGLIVQTIVSGADAPSPADVLNVLRPVVLGTVRRPALRSRAR